jgi:hypothetical protein
MLRNVPAKYYRHPDFLWAVYMAEAALLEPAHARPSDEYEEEAVFRTVEEASAPELPCGSMFFMTSADRIRRRECQLGSRMAA